MATVNSIPPPTTSVAVTLLQTLFIAARDEDQTFFFTSAAAASTPTPLSAYSDSRSQSDSSSSTDAASAARQPPVPNALETPTPGYREALELAVATGGLVLRCFGRPQRYLTQKLTWVTEIDAAARWQLSRPSLPEYDDPQHDHLVTIEVSGRSLFLAFDPASRRFRMARGLQPESMLHVELVAESDRQTWSALYGGGSKLVAGGTTSNTAGAARLSAQISRMVTDELDYAALLEDLQTVRSEWKKGWLCGKLTFLPLLKVYVDNLTTELTADEADTIFLNSSKIAQFQLDFCQGLRVRMGQKSKS